MADYYSLLGVARDATRDEIKKAYRKAALRDHPDRNPGSAEAEERFKKATEAWEVLRDPERRARYDRYGPEGARPQGGFQGGMNFNDALEVFMRDFGGFGDLFGAQRGGRSRPVRGKRVQLALPLTLRDVRNGATRMVQVSVLDRCDTCDGSGRPPGARERSCGSCQGTGEQRVVQQSVFGRFVTVARCSECRGEGRIVTERCHDCRGEGRVRTRRKIQVDVPPGVSSQNFITMRGEGNVGPGGGPRGDIVVQLEVEEDPRFTRDGNDLALDLPITFGQAALGDRVTVPTLEGRSWVEVPPGTQNGDVVRVAGEGVPPLNGRRCGDLLVRLAVWVPTHLTADQRRVVAELRELEDNPPERIDSDRRRGFWSRVREALG